MKLNLSNSEDAALFFESAQEFHHAARQLEQAHVAGQPYYFKPTNYCAFHAIELYLKAYLRMAGVPREKMYKKSLGHNLANLLAEATSKNAIPLSVLDQLQRRSIAQASTDYAGKCFEYPELMFSTIPIGELLNFCEALENGMS